MTEGNTRDIRSELAELASATRRHVELEQGYGADRVPFDIRKVAQFREEMAARRKAAALSKSPATEKGRKLEEVRRELADCCKCVLGKTRKNLVFGVGNPEADLMFVGEAPGADEDEQGIPFVGRAGQVLTAIIEAMGLTREDVYIANVCKCRPPENRTPLPDEAAACMPYLLRQIEIIRPKIIITLGNPATQNLLNTTEGITKIRGQWQQWNGIEVMPTFHPSYLLRNPPAKRPVWEDVQKVHARMKELGCRIGELKSGRG